MDFEDELDDEIQVYYEKDEIDATNDTQKKDQFKDILDMRNAYTGVMQTPRKNKFNIMDWIEQPKLANENAISEVKYSNFCNSPNFPEVEKSL